MEQTSYRKDVHLQPMASHFRLLDCNGGIKNRNDACATAGEKWHVRVVVLLLLVAVEVLP